MGIEDEIRLGKDWPEIEHLNYWRDREVDFFLMNMLASYENYMYYTFNSRWNVDPTRIQYMIGKWFAASLDREDPSQAHRGIMAFRAATKTAIASNFFTWVLLQDPRLCVKVLSSKDEYALKIVKECRIWFDCVDFLEELLHPKINAGTSVMADNARSFNVPGNLGGKDYSFSAVAISGNITGSRAHMLFVDDVEVVNNCDTADKREKLKIWDAEANNILFDKKAVESIGIMYKGFMPFKLYTGTPHTNESLYEYKISQGYKFVIIPGRYPNKKFMKTIGHLVHPELLRDMEENESLCTGYGLDGMQGRVVDIERQSEESMLQKEIEAGKAGFALQYYLDYTLQNVDKFPLKINDLIVADLDHKMARGSYMSEREPQFEIKDLPNIGFPGDRYYRPSFLSQDSYRYERIIMSIDPSGLGKDETAYAIVATLNGNFFVLDWGGLAGGENGYSDEVLETLCHRAKEFAVNEIYVESNFGNGMFIPLISPFLKKIYPCSISEERAKTNKETRIIETLERVLSRRKLIVSKTAVQKDYDLVPMSVKESERHAYRLMYQLSRITKDKNSLAHDDRLDALEMAVRKLYDSIGIDQKEAEDNKFIKDLMNRKLHGLKHGSNRISFGGSMGKSVSFTKRR